MLPENFNGINNLLTPEELISYQNAVYPFNLPILSKSLETKLKDDPDYEVWVPVLYHKANFKSDLKRIIHTEVKPYKMFVSNKGKIISLRRNDPHLFTFSINADGYPTASIRPTKGSGASTFFLHRLLACCFIGIPEHLGAAHPKDLQINHKDGVKTNYSLDNLEWCTCEENVQHAFDTGLKTGIRGWDNKYSKPLKGTVVMGAHRGFEFVLCGKVDFKKYKFSIAHAHRCANGEHPKVYGCAWAFATNDEIEDLPREIPEEVLEDLSKTNTRVTYEIIATNIETGNSFTISGGTKELISLGFIGTSVSAVIKGKNKTHKGHIFEKVS